MTETPITSAEDMPWKPPPAPVQLTREELCAVAAFLSAAYTPGTGPDCTRDALCRAMGKMITAAGADWTDWTAGRGSWQRAVGNVYFRPDMYARRFARVVIETCSDVGESFGRTVIARGDDVLRLLEAAMHAAGDPS